MYPQKQFCWSDDGQFNWKKTLAAMADILPEPADVNRLYNYAKRKISKFSFKMLRYNYRNFFLRIPWLKSRWTDISVSLQWSFEEGYKKSSRIQTSCYRLVEEKKQRYISIFEIRKSRWNFRAFGFSRKWVLRAVFWRDDSSIWNLFEKKRTVGVWSRGESSSEKT